MSSNFNMSDVFISYSRKDKIFARELDNRFKQDNQEVWVDWEDIPESANWMAEIQAGIEGASTFLFVISSDSVASEICTEEIEHAVKHNKRIIPVFLHEITKGQELHPAVASHNWISFNEEDPVYDFEESFQRLQKTLKTDLAYTRQHTRYLVRAREWETREKHASFLLNGLELAEAQLWIAENKEPPSTELQRDYIRASMRAEHKREEAKIKQQEKELQLQKKVANRMRYLIAVMGVFLLITGGLVVQLQQSLRIQQEISVGVDEFFAQGTVYLEQRAYGQAIAEFTRYIALSNLTGSSERLMEAYMGRAQAYAGGNEFVKAQADYDKILELISEQDSNANLALIEEVNLAIALLEQNRVRLASFNLMVAFEAGESSYAAYSNYDAGIISYGIGYFTLAGGSLISVLDLYLENSDSAIAQSITEYQERYQARDESLRNDTEFRNLLIFAAEEETMQVAQRQVLTERFWQRVQENYIEGRQIQLPLSHALLFDMGINFGVNHGFVRLAERNLEVEEGSMVGENGITEEELIIEVASLRKQSHDRQAEQNDLPGLAARGDFWVELIESGDWQLQGDEDGNLYVNGIPVQVRDP